MVDTCTWLFDEFDSWLAGSDQMLIVEGGPGVGKSCWAAQLAVSHSDIVRATYFCRHDDERRKMATSMIRSLAYQLAAIVPGLWKPVLAAAGRQWVAGHVGCH